MPKRPHSPSELAEFAEDDSTADLFSLKDWLRVADDFRLRAVQAHLEGDLEAAFLFLSRSAAYILEKMPHSAGYHELSPPHKKNLHDVR
jgi:hypothetical protein